MKTKFIISSLFSLLLGFTSCTVDDNNVIGELGDKPVIVSPEEGNSVILNPANPTNTAITVVWNHAKYSVNTEINYTVEIDKAGDNFDTPVVLQTVTARQASLNVTQFNAKILSTGLIPFATAGLDIRVKAAIGNNNALEIISNKITINVTPFTTELPKLAVAGNHQGWNPATAPRIAASAYGLTDFEGYVWLDGDYKFVAQSADGSFSWPPSGGPDYGDDGTFSGILIGTGESNCNAAAGYYYVKANTTAGTYSATPTTWSIIGNGAAGWSVDTPMTYNSATKKWTATVTLSAQSAPNDGIKFRANGSWDINLGDNGANGSLEYGGTNISTPAGTHTITLDLSNPRAYTYSIQ